MNAEDITALGFIAGERVDITSHFDGEKRKVERFMIVPYEIPRRCVGAYYPETNPLAQIGNIADGSRQPVYKSLVVTLERSKSLSSSIS
jgi:anaerobic selenocysteine-containing dehydrogenase